MRALLKTWFVPGTPAFLLLVLSIGVLLLAARRTRRIGAMTILAIMCAYACLSVPIVADAIARPLLATRAPDLRGLAHEEATAVVMLAGDSPVGRFAETLALFRRIDPMFIIVSGPNEWSQLFQQAGVPPARLLVLNQSRTTREQALDLRPLLTARSFRRVYLVASSLQTRRALATFEALHLAVTPAPSPLDHRVRRAGGWRLLPQRAALRLSGDAIYEYGALIYYRWNRWLPRGADVPA